MQKQFERFKHRENIHAQNPTPSGHGRCSKFAVEFEEPIMECTTLRQYDPSTINLIDEAKAKPVLRALVSSFESIQALRTAQLSPTASAR